MLMRARCLKTMKILPDPTSPPPAFLASSITPDTSSRQDPPSLSAHNSASKRVNVTLEPILANVHNSHFFYLTQNISKVVEGHALGTPPFPFPTPHSMTNLRNAYASSSHSGVLIKLCWCRGWARHHTSSDHVMFHQQSRLHAVILSSPPRVSTSAPFSRRSCTTSQ